MSDQCDKALDALAKVKPLTIEDAVQNMVASMREARSSPDEAAAAFYTPQPVDLKDVYEVTLRNFEWLLAEIRSEAGKSHPCAKLARTGQKWLEAAFAGKYPDFTKKD